MVLLEILGMEEGFFWQNVGFICVFTMLAFYVFFGFKFIKDGTGYDSGTAQRAYFIGLGLFIISVAVGEGIYLSDLVYRAYVGERLFLPLTSKENVMSWQSIVGYEMASLIDRDYYVAAFTFILLSMSFLMKPLEEFMLRRKPIFTYLNRILVIFPVLIRFLEVNLYSWFNIQVLDGSIPYYIFSVLWVITLGVLVISIVLLLSLYLKMGISAPKGSTIKKKSFLIIFGIIFWMVGVFTTATVFRELESPENWYLVAVVPLILVIALTCLIKGFKRDF